MESSTVQEQIAELEKEIARLAPGSIAVKRNAGKVFYYHRISRGGSRVENYIPFEKVDSLRKEIEKRKALEARLRELKRSVPASPSKKQQGHRFKTFVRIGESLQRVAALAKTYRRRDLYDALSDYVFGPPQDKVLILYGLRRTGKTTLIRQAILSMTPDQFDKTAFIQIGKENTLSQLYADLQELERLGFQYIFIDEVTMLEDFIEGAAIFSDIFAAGGMKIVLSGTDSLGFLFTERNQLYDRCILLHTTAIPYREFERVLGIQGIDEYIRYGGTMSPGGVHYNDLQSPFESKERTDEYIDSAIAQNIQHSLKHYEEGGHFRLLYDLYAKGELTGAINRVVEDLNHRFTKEVLTRTYRSVNLSVVSRNLLRDKVYPFNLEVHIDRNAVERTLKSMLDILDKPEQTVDIDQSHAEQIKEYLSLLDLITDIEVLHLPGNTESTRKTVFTQPGMRYALADALIQALLSDRTFGDLEVVERYYVLDRVLDTVKGFILEEIVLQETRNALQNRKVYQVQFAAGELDMVVHDPQTLTCQIYEIKHSIEAVPDQYRHLINEQYCAYVEKRLGRITGKFVIYRGDAFEDNRIQYLKVEDYLKTLG